MIAAFDLETTGLNKNTDQIIQFSGIVFNPDNYSIINELNLIIQPTGNYNIAVTAYFKHGITPEKLKDKPHLRDVAHQIVEFIGDNDILTYNGNHFDLDFLQKELNKYGYYIDFSTRKCYDAFIEEKRRYGNKLVDTFKRYTGKTMEEYGYEAHDALSDVKATIEVFKHQQNEKPYEAEKFYGDDGMIVDMEFRGKIYPCFSSGKYAQLPVILVKTLDIGYLNWAISDKSNFANNTKKYITNIINVSNN